MVILMLNVDVQKVCTQRPLQFQENGAFVYDRSSLRGQDDWLATDLGSFINNGNGGRIITLKEGVMTDSIRLPRRVEDRPVLRRGQFLVLTTYWKHAKYTDFNRHTTIIQRHDGSSINYALAQFFFTGEPHKVSPKKNRSNKPFYPTTSSTKHFIKENAYRPIGPGTVFDRAFEQAGGVIDLEAISDAPRNVQQVKNARQRVRLKKQTDEFQDLLSFSAENDGVRGLQWTPTPRVVFVNQGQMEEIITNCCGPNATGVFSIDTTYNVGNFYVTATSYQNRKFIHKRTGKAANLPGPAMFHVKQDASQFQYFANTLLEAKYEFEQVRYIGGDRSQSQQGFLRPLKGAKFVPCKKHIEDDMTRKMSALGMDVAEQQTVLKDIFGSVQDQEKGLVDSLNSAEFDEKVEVLKAVWNPQFRHYFVTYVADDVKEGMSPQIRRTIGLKDDFYYNNALECQNFRYKQKIQEMKKENLPGVKVSQCSWLEAIQTYQAMLHETRNNLQRAIIGRGPFQLAPDFAHLECEERWMVMTPEERRKHLAKLDPFVALDKSCASDVILPIPSAVLPSRSDDDGRFEYQDVYAEQHKSSSVTQVTSDAKLPMPCAMSPTNIDDDGQFNWQDFHAEVQRSSNITQHTGDAILPMPCAVFPTKSYDDGQLEKLGVHAEVQRSSSNANCVTRPFVVSATETTSGSSMDTISEHPEPSSLGSIGQFEDSGLPDYLKGSWGNAQKIIDRNGVGGFPGSESKRVVVSLSQGDTCHIVTISRSRTLQCDGKCPKYNLHKLCAHTLAVAFQVGLLYDVCKSYKHSISGIVKSVIPREVGKKENEKAGRKRKSQEQYRDVSGFTNRTEVDVHDALLTEGYEVVFIQETSALGCYGCKGKVRQKPSDPVPGDPYDIFLRRKEHRVFRKKGSKSTALSITKRPEYVYYHPVRSCLPGKVVAGVRGIWAEDATKSKLTKKHKELILREFNFYL